MIKAKRPGTSLADALARAEAEENPAPATKPAARPAAAPIEREIAPSDGVSISFFVTPHDRQRLKMMGVQTGKSLNTLCHEAFAAYLEGLGLPGLEPTAANRPSGRRPRR